LEVKAGFVERALQGELRRDAFTAAIGRELVVVNGLEAVEANGVNDLGRRTAPLDDGTEVRVRDDARREEEVDPRLAAAEPSAEIAPARPAADRPMAEDGPPATGLAFEVDGLEGQFLDALADVGRATPPLQVGRAPWSGGSRSVTLGCVGRG
jgi:hypothetical protein